MPDQNETTTPDIENTFVCDCREEWLRSACKGEPFFKEHEGKRYCVLHYPDKDKLEDFRAALKKKLDAQDFDFQGVWFPEKVSFGTREFGLVNFSRAVFSAGAGFDEARFGGNANFSSAKFEIDADFYMTTFSNGARFEEATFGVDANFQAASFYNITDFRSAKFNAKANFRSARFSDHANFNSARFNSKADFMGAAFRKDTKFSRFASFKRATFNAEANFHSAEFSLDAYFTAARFSEDAYFSVARFSKASFTKASFQADARFVGTSFNAFADFEGATFSANTNFEGARFCTEAYFRNVIFKNYVSFKKISGEPERINFQDTYIEKPERVSFHTSHLQPYWFINVDCRKFEFTDCAWNLDLKKVLKAMSTPCIAAPPSLIAITYRQLADNAEANHRYHEASNFRYNAFEARRIEKFKGFVPWRLDWWYWLASGYGERVGRAFVVFVALFALFAFGYGRVGFDQSSKAMAAGVAQATAIQSDTVGKPLGWKEAFVYSFNVSILQKPEPKPLTLAAKILVSLETVLGPAQAALLALAVRRRFMR